MTVEVTDEMMRAAGHIDSLIEIIERDYVVRRRARPRTKTSPLPRGGRPYVDPGPWACCARCSHLRREHRGRSRLGSCPDQTGRSALRFRLREEDKQRA